MNESTNRPVSDIERLLTEAGLTFTVVERCPEARCSVCGRRPAPRAA